MKQAQRQIDHDMRQVMIAGAATLEEVMKALNAGRLDPQWQELARQRAQRMLADESALQTQAEAEAEIAQHLPALPRGVKRLIHQLRILFVIADEKHMFGGLPELQSKHVAKWAVLLERWPELGSARSSPTLDA